VSILKLLTAAAEDCRRTGELRSTARRDVQLSLRGWADSAATDAATDYYCELRC